MTEDIKEAYEENASWKNKVNARARKQRTTHDKKAVAQVTLDGGQISIATAEDLHRAHVKYMEAQAREKI